MQVNLSQNEGSIWIFLQTMEKDWYNNLVQEEGKERKTKEKRNKVQHTLSTHYYQNCYVYAYRHCIRVPAGAE